MTEPCFCCCPCEAGHIKRGIIELPGIDNVLLRTTRNELVPARWDRSKSSYPGEAVGYVETPDGERYAFGVAPRKIAGITVPRREIPFVPGGTLPPMLPGLNRDWPYLLPFSPFKNRSWEPTGGVLIWPNDSQDWPTGLRAQQFDHWDRINGYVWHHPDLPARAGEVSRPMREPGSPDFSNAINLIVPMAWRRNDDERAQYGVTLPHAWGREQRPAPNNVGDVTWFGIPMPFATHPLRPIEVLESPNAFPHTTIYLPVKFFEHGGCETPDGSLQGWHGRWFNYGDYLIQPVILKIRTPGDIVSDFEWRDFFTFQRSRPQAPMRKVLPRVNAGSGITYSDDGTVPVMQYKLNIPNQDIDDAPYSSSWRIFVPGGTGAHPITLEDNAFTSLPLTGGFPGEFDPPDWSVAARTFELGMPVGFSSDSAGFGFAAWVEGDFPVAITVSGGTVVATAISQRIGEKYKLKAIIWRGTQLSLEGPVYLWDYVDPLTLDQITAFWPKRVVITAGVFTGVAHDPFTNEPLFTASLFNVSDDQNFPLRDDNTIWNTPDRLFSPSPWRFPTGNTAVMAGYAPIYMSAISHNNNTNTYQFTNRGSFAIGIATGDANAPQGARLYAAMGSESIYSLEPLPAGISVFSGDARTNLPGLPVEMPLMIGGLIRLEGKVDSTGPTDSRVDVFSTYRGQRLSVKVLIRWQWFPSLGPEQPSTLIVSYSTEFGQLVQIDADIYSAISGNFIATQTGTYQWFKLSPNGVWGTDYLQEYAIQTTDRFRMQAAFKNVFSQTQPDIVHTFYDVPKPTHTTVGTVLQGEYLGYKGSFDVVTPDILRCGWYDNAFGVEEGALATFFYHESGVDLRCLWPDMTDWPDQVWPQDNPPIPRPLNPDGLATWANTHGLLAQPGAAGEVPHPLATAAVSWRGLSWPHTPFFSCEVLLSEAETTGGPNSELAVAIVKITGDYRLLVAQKLLNNSHEVVQDVLFSEWIGEITIPNLGEAIPHSPWLHSNWPQPNPTLMFMKVPTRDQFSGEYPIDPLTSAPELVVVTRIVARAGSDNEEPVMFGGFSQSVTHPAAITYQPAQQLWLPPSSVSLAGALDIWQQKLPYEQGFSADNDLENVTANGTITLTFPDVVQKPTGTQTIIGCVQVWLAGQIEPPETPITLGSATPERWADEDYTVFRFYPPINPGLNIDVQFIGADVIAVRALLTLIEV
ncbi:MAG: hypothetical protein ACRC1W_03760 [Shewanella sp.]